MLSRNIRKTKNDTKTGPALVIAGLKRSRGPIVNQLYGPQKPRTSKHKYFEKGIAIFKIKLDT